MFQGSFTTWAHVGVFAKTEKNASRKYLWVNYGLKIVGNGREAGVSIGTQVSGTTTTSAYRHAQAPAVVRCTADMKCPPRNVGSGGLPLRTYLFSKQMATWLRPACSYTCTPTLHRAAVHTALHSACCTLLRQQEACNRWEDRAWPAVGKGVERPSVR